MLENIFVPKGLAGVITDNTSISKVMAKTNSLTYRGYAVQDLCEKCSWEEVAFLLVNGELPSFSEYSDFIEKEREYRNISQDLIDVIKKFPMEAYPMDTLRTGVSFLGLEDKRIWDDSPATNMDKFIQLLAKIPTIIAAFFRHKEGKKIIAPRTDLSASENFFHMCFNKIPEMEVIKAFDVSLILYAEHSFNASTFASRVITSTTSDIYSAVCGGI